MNIESIRLGLGTFSEPGPGFLPFVATSVIASLCSISLVLNLQKPSAEKAVHFRLGPFWGKALFLMVLSFLYLLLWNNLGFILSSAIWLSSVFWIGGLRSWVKNLTMTVSIVLAAYFLFGKVGACLLPVGILGF